MLRQIKIIYILKSKNYLLYSYLISTSRKEGGLSIICYFYTFVYPLFLRSLLNVKLSEQNPLSHPFAWKFARKLLDMQIVRHNVQSLGRDTQQPNIRCVSSTTKGHVEHKSSMLRRQHGLLQESVRACRTVNNMRGKQ